MTLTDYCESHNYGPDPNQAEFCMLISSFIYIYILIIYFIVLEF